MTQKKINLTVGQSVLLGHKLRAIRKQQGRSIRFVALAAGISPTYVSHIEHGGKANPTMRRMRAFASSLELDLDALVEEVRREVKGTYEQVKSI